MINVSKKVVDETHVLVPYGRVDHASSKYFEEILQDVVNDSQGTFAIDFTNFNYISSSGLRILILVTKTLEARGGKMVLCNIPTHIQEVFVTSGFDQIFNLCEGITEAVSELQDNSPSSKSS